MMKKLDADSMKKVKKKINLSLVESSIAWKKNKSVWRRGRGKKKAPVNLIIAEKPKRVII